MIPVGSKSHIMDQNDISDISDEIFQRILEIFEIKFEYQIES